MCLQYITRIPVEGIMTVQTHFLGLYFITITFVL